MECWGVRRNRTWPQRLSLRPHCCQCQQARSKCKCKKNTYTMNNHLHPAIPFRPSIPANTPAAISPENPVARICAQYRSAMRVATSVRSSAPSRTSQSHTLTFPRVENTQHVSRAWIKWSLGNSQEESTCDQPPKALNKRRTSAHNSPNQHPCAHVDARLDARDEHVGRDLH